MRRLCALLTLSCLVLLAACKSDNNNSPGPGNQPTITGITPNQVSRGQLSVEGRIQGTNLGGVLSVNLGDGITVEQVTGLSSTEIGIRFSVSVNAAAGARTIAVSTSAGTATIATLLTVQNNRAPTARFTVTPSTGGKNTNFLLDGSNSSDPDGVVATFHWTFGDNQEANGRITTHRFGATGRFTVTLTVTDRNNASNKATRVIEVVDGLAPVPHFSFSPATGDIGTVVHFDASASKDHDGTIAKAEWNFGDGEAAVGLIVDHKFTKSGTFEVVLTITDNDGLESSLGKDLRIEKFNQDKAIAEITDVVVRFFKRFSKLEKLTAEDIVVDWSASPGCTGRDREIKVIERQKEIVQKTNADIVGDIEIFIHPTHVVANCNVTAKFTFTLKDGTKGSGTATHDFQFIFEDEKWVVCNFTVSNESTATLKSMLSD